jgi:signal transduction histidine kinase
MNKKQFIFSNLFIILIFIVSYFIYPEYKKKNDLEGLKYRSKQYSAQIENYARDALERNNIDKFYETYLSIINSADIKYLIIENESQKKLFQFNSDYKQSLNLTVEAELEPVIFDSTIHVRTSIFTENDSLLAELSVGFDIYHVYKEFDTLRIIAVGITILLFILLFFLVFYFNNKTKTEKKERQISIEKVVEATKKSNDAKSDSSLIFAEDLKELTKNLTLLINEFNLKNKADEKSLKNVELNILNNKLEFEFIAKLYKVFNSYRNITTVPEILSSICRDVCEEFLYDVSILVTWEKESLVMYESYFRGMPSFQEKFNKKCKNLPIKKSEEIYQVYTNKEPIFTHQFSHCDILQELNGRTHFVQLPILSGEEFWGVLVVGLNGTNIKVDYRDVSKMQFYCNTVATFLETIKKFETLGLNLKSKTRELVKANTLLRRSIREKDEFLRAISHDLIAPLRNISGLINSIERKYGESLDNGLQDRLFRIRRNVEKDMELVNEILEISRVKSRKLVVEKVDLNKLIFSIFENFNHELQEKKIKVKIQEKFPIIYFDRFIINQILQNLIDNAIKYIRSDSKLRNIELKWRYVHNKLAFAIADTGIGVPPEDLDKIFSIFYRSNNEMNVESDGKGVGLAMIKSLLEKFNGEIWVKSKVDSGSIFYFTFPDTVLKPPIIKKL